MDRRFGAVGTIKNGGLPVFLTKRKVPDRGLFPIRHTAIEDITGLVAGHALDENAIATGDELTLERNDDMASVAALHFEGEMVFTEPAGLLFLRVEAEKFEILQGFRKENGVLLFRRQGYGWRIGSAGRTGRIGRFGSTCLADGGTRLSPPVV